MPTEQDISTFVDAGSMSLRDYTFVSSELRTPGTTRRLLGAANDSGDMKQPGDVEEPVSFRINQTGNIFYSTTGKEIGERGKSLFDSVTVLFAAMTKALASKNKTLFDYEAWGSIIRSSGFFVEVQKYTKMLQINAGSIAINTQIVQQLLPGLQSGSSMEIAKGVLSAINGEYGASETKQKTEFGHLMFICEELFGAPSVTVRLFHSTMSSYQQITKSGCHRSVKTSTDQKQDADTFLFVSPDTIAELADKFVKVPEEYANLVDRLAAGIDPPPAKEPEKK